MNRTLVFVCPVQLRLSAEGSNAKHPDCQTSLISALLSPLEGVNGPVWHLSQWWTSWGDRLGQGGSCVFGASLFSPSTAKVWWPMSTYRWLPLTFHRQILHSSQWAQTYSVKHHERSVHRRHRFLRRSREKWLHVQYQSLFHSVDQKERKTLPKYSSFKHKLQARAASF